MCSLQEHVSSGLTFLTSTPLPLLSYLGHMPAPWSALNADWLLETPRVPAHYKGSCFFDIWGEFQLTSKCKLLSLLSRVVVGAQPRSLLALKKNSLTQDIVFQHQLHVTIHNVVSDSSLVTLTNVQFSFLMNVIRNRSWDIPPFLRCCVVDIVGKPFPLRKTQLSSLLYK